MLASFGRLAVTGKVLVATNAVEGIGPRQIFLNSHTVLPFLELLPRDAPPNVKPS